MNPVVAFVAGAAIASIGFLLYLNNAVCVLGHCFR